MRKTYKAENLHASRRWSIGICQKIFEWNLFMVMESSTGMV